MSACALWHHRCMAGHGSDTGSDDLVLEPAGWEQNVKLRVSPEHSAELRQLIETAGVPISAGAEFSHGPVTDLLIATVQTPEMWVALGGSVTAFLTRNSFRRVRVSKDEIRLTGYDRDDAEHIVRVLREQVDQRGREWERIKQDRPPDDDQQPPSP